MTGMLHVLLISWSDGVGQMAIDEVRRAALAMLHTVPGIVSLEEGPNSSCEGLGHGFEYGLFVSFVDATARDAYLLHPRHEVLADHIRACASRIVVFDIATRSADGVPVKS
jgi:hypothetical protein